MFKKLIIVLALLPLVACGGSRGPSKSEMQKALNRVAKDTPWVSAILGNEKIEVKESKCAKAGDDIYDCGVSIRTSGGGKSKRIPVRVSKLDGEWQAELRNPGSDE